MTQPVQPTSVSGIQVVSELLNGKDRFLPVSVVAALLSVTDVTVRTWLQDGAMEGTKVNTMWRVRASEVARFITHGPLVPERNAGSD